jgi:hypothetical protein
MKAPVQNINDIDTHCRAYEHAQRVGDRQHSLRHLQLAINAAERGIAALNDFFPLLALRADPEFASF